MNHIVTDRATTEAMLGASELLVADPGHRPEHPMPSAETPMGTLYLELGADAAREATRLKKELQKLDEVIGKIKAKLRNEAFRSKAPEAVIAQEREKLEKISEKADRLRRNLSVLEE